MDSKSRTDLNVIWDYIGFALQGLRVLQNVCTSFPDHETMHIHDYLSWLNHKREGVGRCGKVFC